jgi:hypothetical protein
MLDLHGYEYWLVHVVFQMDLHVGFETCLATWTAIPQVDKQNDGGDPPPRIL